VPDSSGMAARRAHALNRAADVIEEHGSGVIKDRISGIRKHAAGGITGAYHADMAIAELLGGLAEIVAEQQSQLEELRANLKANLEGAGSGRTWAESQNSSSHGGRET
jgi:hypothetical protein